MQPFAAVVVVTLQLGYSAFEPAVLSLPLTSHFVDETIEIVCWPPGLASVS